MKSSLYILLLGIVLVTSCRKDPKIVPPPAPIDPCALTGYSLYSTTDFAFEKKHLSSPSVVGPFNFNVDSISLGNPVVNPNNPYEICYSYRSESMSGLESEIWKFNFCTGQKTKIASNFYYNLDWSSNGWLLYTGSGHQIFKVKEDGDSLIQLSDLSGFNHAGKWNDDATMYFIGGDHGIGIYDANGIAIDLNPSFNYAAIDWIDNETLLSPYYGTNYKFHSFKFALDQVSVVNTNWACSTCPYIYNRDQNLVYGSVNMGTGSDDYFLKYDLTLNTVDTISTLYDSYSYKSGTYVRQTNQIITILIHKSWKDSVQNEVYVNSDLLILNPDGTNERLIHLPD